MANDLRGKVALITGASSGVGWQAAVRLAEQGVKVCVTARRGEALEQLRARIERAGGTCLVAPGDVTSDLDVLRVRDACVDGFKRIDLLVNNAAVQAYARFEEIDWAIARQIIDTTFFGYLRFARAVLPVFRGQGDGHIINVLSMLALGAAPMLSMYTAAKHALSGWSKCLQLELRGSGIPVSDLMLPSVSTPMFDHAPTVLNLAPRPVPPTYDTDMAARRIVRLARRPKPTTVPVFLQGRPALWASRLVKPLFDAVLSKYGVRMQVRLQAIRRPTGNVFEPVPQGVGPYGSVPPTPLWKRALFTAGLFGAVGAAVGGAALAGRAVVRAART